MMKRWRGKRLIRGVVALCTSMRYSVLLQKEEKDVKKVLSLINDYIVRNKLKLKDGLVYSKIEGSKCTYKPVLDIKNLEGLIVRDYYPKYYSLLYKNLSSTLSYIISSRVLDNLEVSYNHIELCSGMLCVSTGEVVEKEKGIYCFHYLDVYLGSDITMNYTLLDIDNLALYFTIIAGKRICKDDLVLLDDDGLLEEQFKYCKELSKCMKGMLGSDITTLLGGIDYGTCKGFLKGYMLRELYTNVVMGVEKVDIYNGMLGVWYDVYFKKNADKMDNVFLLVGNLARESDYLGNRIYSNKLTFLLVEDKMHNLEISYEDIVEDRTFIFFVVVVILAGNSGNSNEWLEKLIYPRKKAEYMLDIEKWYKKRRNVEIKCKR